MKFNMNTRETVALCILVAAIIFLIFAFSPLGNRPTVNKLTQEAYEMQVRADSIEAQLRAVAQKHSDTTSSVDKPGKGTRPSHRKSDSTKIRHKRSKATADKSHSSPAPRHHRDEVIN